MKYFVNVVIILLISTAACAVDFTLSGVEGFNIKHRVVEYAGSGAPYPYEGEKDPVLQSINVGGIFFGVSNIQVVPELVDRTNTIYYKAKGKFLIIQGFVENRSASQKDLWPSFRLSTFSRQYKQVGNKEICGFVPAQYPDLKPLALNPGELIYFGLVFDVGKDEQVAALKVKNLASIWGLRIKEVKFVINQEESYDPPNSEPYCSE